MRRCSRKCERKLCKVTVKARVAVFGNCKKASTSNGATCNCAGRAGRGGWSSCVAGHKKRKLNSGEATKLCKTL